MAKSSGLGDNFYVAGYDLSGDVGSLEAIGGGPAELIVTGIDKSAIERLGGQRDGRIDYTAFFNDAASHAHPVLSPLPTGDILSTYCRGTALGSAAACLLGKKLNYDPTRGNDGALTIAIQHRGNGYGLEWGKLLTAGKITVTGAGNQTGVDFGAAGADGLQAYLHVFAETVVDATITIQESSDDGAGDAYAAVTGGAFTQITAGAPLTERIATAAGLAVERYLRVNVATTGGITSLTFAVVVCRNDSPTAF